MGAAHLRDRVVAVADEDTLVQPRGALALDAVERSPALRRVGGELVQEEAPEGPGVAGITGEERALHGLRQVGEGEDGPVEIGEVRAENRLLLGGEGLDRVAHLRS